MKEPPSTSGNIKKKKGPKSQLLTSASNCTYSLSSGVSLLIPCQAVITELYCTAACF